MRANLWPRNFVAVSIGSVLGTLAFGTRARADVQLVTFDDLPTASFTVIGGYRYYYGAVPESYQGLHWTNFGVTLGLSDTNSGFQPGLVSGQNDAYNYSGGAAATIGSTGHFNFLSAYLTSAWRDNLQVQV